MALVHDRHLALDTNVKSCTINHMSFEDENLFLKRLAAANQAPPIPQDNLLEVGFGLVNSLGSTEDMGQFSGDLVWCTKPQRIYTTSGKAVDVMLVKEFHDQENIVRTFVNVPGDRFIHRTREVTSYTTLELRIWVPTDPNLPSDIESKELIASILLSDDKDWGREHGAVHPSRLDDLTVAAIGEIFQELQNPSS